MRIEDEQWEDAWSRTSRATQQIAARLECLQVCIDAREPTWEHEGRCVSPLRARQEDAPLDVRADVDAPLVAADAGAHGKCASAGAHAKCASAQVKQASLPAKTGYLQVLQRKVRERQGGAEEENGEAWGPGLVWRRAWFVLEHQGASLPQLHMCRAPGSALPLASFSLAASQLGR